MADYYELLGVSEDAQVDEIRNAYRDRKAAVTGDEKNKDTDASKAEVAQLNKAWNVLSDPFQRGRYDIDRANRSESDDDEADEDEDRAPARRPAKAAAAAKSTGKRQTASERRAARANQPPTVTLPPGTYFPSTKRRLSAMGIDLAVLVAIVIASLVVGTHLSKSQHPTQYDAASRLRKTTIPAQEKVVSAAKKSESATEKAKGANAPETKAATDAAKAAQKKLDDLNKQLTKLDETFVPIQRLVASVAFFLCLLVLMVPSVTIGQTLGKRMQQLRVYSVSGQPAGWQALTRRYGVLVFAAFLLSTFLSPVGGLIVVFVATLWTRNPNQQGWQDKFAKTLVLTDVEE
jgi:curved DNA-binding protein CbpA